MSGPLAQQDRAADFESAGSGFESSRGRQWHCVRIPKPGRCPLRGKAAKVLDGAGALWTEQWNRRTGRESAMKVVNVNGVHLHCADEGNPDGFPVVFSNSLGTDFRLWDGVFERMPKNMRLIRYDTRGHGLSSCPEGPYSINDLAGDCAGLMERLGVTECAFVGLSIGGLTAQELVLRWPGLVRAAVLSNTGARIGEPSMWRARIESARSGRLQDVSDAVMERWFSARFRQERKSELEGWRAMLTRTTAEGYARLLRGDHGCRLQCRTWSH